MCCRWETRESGKPAVGESTSAAKLDLWISWDFIHETKASTVFFILTFHLIHIFLTAFFLCEHLISV